ncbi:sulfite oxidase-like oxidoreductase [Sphingomonas jatrophae]|uniref:DMSO/TMAO reductase YedYZ, molybdopterin-dependent catalytic subunit n=1 Tax=Sphingomonas jatrophae TaxID=1166337 RepID=A0A1I6JTH3_9SPHN|nr:sulfite oxidase-like oxidoreductase [Sphingomonas jatrophae]SFR82243.1 DMSO/TMAO reductase YedYZ, molybdopterin-dependent catalytic subunit [Sphingomonas jatrophae]
MDEAAPPPDSKLTRTKQKWAQEGRFLAQAPVRAAGERLPPGQHLVKNWPVLDLGRQPDVSHERWRLKIGGMVERPVTLDWAGLMALPQVKSRSDIHCVTSWSRYDNDWAGVSTRTLLDLVGPRDEATHALLHGYDGYTTNVPLADFAAEDALLAHGWQGRPLTREHGGPARLVIPHLYFWKSAKWISAIELLGADRPGFWEVNGYHMRGDPWAEERYS